ncbi:MAG: DegV family protein [Asgard group archaeon]|nr:DegV family protein [Asgard group archaeon]
MAKVKILTDSTCDLPPTIIEKLDIGVIPANIIFDDKVYSHYDLSNDTFYQKLEEGALPSTGVPPPAVFKKSFDKAVESNDDVIVFTLSQKLSGIYSTATSVNSQFFNNKLTIIDSQAVTVDMGLIVYEAAKKAQEGLTKDEIIIFIEDLVIPNAQLFGIVNTLKYLKKGGRINTISWLVGSILSIKPIIRIEDGLLASPGKVRGADEAIKLLKKICRKIVNERMTDTIFVGHSHAYEKGKALYDYLVDLPNSPTDVILAEIGPIVGSHVGIGALGIAWVGKYVKRWAK